MNKSKTPKPLRLSAIFRRMGERLSDRRRWVKGTYATTKSGRRCYCLVGLLGHVQGIGPAEAGRKMPGYMRLLEAIEQHQAGKGCDTGIEGWNDKDIRTIGEVRDVVKLAHRNALKAERVARAAA